MKFDYEITKTGTINIDVYEIANNIMCNLSDILYDELSLACDGHTWDLMQEDKELRNQVVEAVQDALVVKLYEEYLNIDE